MKSQICDPKRRLMLMLAQDPEVFELIANPEIDPECCDDLIYNNIFPFLKVDFTETQAGNYIGLGLDFPLIKEKETFKNGQITFLIICNTETLRIGNTSYSRPDRIAERIVELFQGSGYLGFPMYLYSDNEGIHSSRFYYRRLTFKKKENNNAGECE
jgi:hypothetical protein